MRCDVGSSSGPRQVVGPLAEAHATAVGLGKWVVVGLVPAGTPLQGCAPPCAPPSIEKAH
jgi:hypothetical protein